MALFAFLILADVPDSSLSSWSDLAKAGGPICIFILIFVVCAVALSKWVWLPLNAQKNESEDKRRKDLIEIATRFENASGKLENSVKRLDEMHERCHARDVEANGH